MLKFALLFACINAGLAWYRGRNPIAWFVISIPMTVFGTLLLFVLPDKTSDTAEPEPEPAQRAEGGVIDTTPPEPKMQTGFDLHEWYYTNANGQQMGPVAFTELKRLWSEKTLSPTDYVWNDTMADWKKIRDYATLYQHLAQ